MLTGSVWRIHGPDRVLQSMDFRKTLVCSRALPKRCMESAQGLVQVQSSKRGKGLDVQTVVIRALSTPIDSQGPMPMRSPIGVWANHSFCGDLWRPWCTWPIPKAAGRYGRESASGYRSVGMESAVQASSRLARGSHAANIGEAPGAA